MSVTETYQNNCSALFLLIINILILCSSNELNNICIKMLKLEHLKCQFYSDSDILSNDYLSE